MSPDATAVVNPSSLIRPGESPEQAVRRLERTPNYSTVIGTDEGQRLLELANRQVAARRLGRDQ